MFSTPQHNSNIILNAEIEIDPTVQKIKVFLSNPFLFKVYGVLFLQVPGNPPKSCYFCV
jgi:hypothetical protein